MHTQSTDTPLSALCLHGRTDVVCERGEVGGKYDRHHAVLGREASEEVEEGLRTQCPGREEHNGLGIGGRGGRPEEREVRD